MFGLPAYIDQIVRAGVLGAICLAFIILAVRLVGLRSFSKMTAFDFVITLATGSLLATVTSMWTCSLWSKYTGSPGSGPGCIELKSSSEPTWTPPACVSTLRRWMVGGWASCVASALGGGGGWGGRAVGSSSGLSQTAAQR